MLPETRLAPRAQNRETLHATKISPQDFFQGLGCQKPSSHHKISPQDFFQGLGCQKPFC